MKNSKGVINNKQILQINKKKKRLDTTGWCRWSIGNFIGNCNLSIQTSGRCPILSPSCKRRRPKFSGIFRWLNLGQTTRPCDCLYIKNMPKVDLAVSANRIKLKESENRVKYQDLARELKQIMKQEGDSNTNCNCCIWINPQSIGKETERLENKRTRGNHSNYSIIKISQNTLKCPGDLSRLAVTQPPMKNQMLTLVWKTLKGVK